VSTIRGWGDLCHTEACVRSQPHRRASRAPSQFESVKSRVPSQLLRRCLSLPAAIFGTATVPAPPCLADRRDRPLQQRWMYTDLFVRQYYVKSVEATVQNEVVTISWAAHTARFRSFRSAPTSLRHPIYKRVPWGAQSMYSSPR
jgi:hypothetical protein